MSQTPNFPPNRTPFDDDLIQDPDAPRNTQPLPTPPLPLTPTSSTRSALPSGPSTINSAPILPPQVVVPNAAPGNNAPRTGVLPTKIPMTFIVGLAAVGGALAVIFISGAFSKLLPHSSQTASSNAATQTSRDANPNGEKPNRTVPMIAPLASPSPNHSPRIVVAPTPIRNDNATSQDFPTPENSARNDSTNDDSPNSSSSDTNLDNTRNDNRNGDTSNGNSSNSANLNGNGDNANNGNSGNSSSANGNSDSNSNANSKARGDSDTDSPPRSNDARSGATPDIEYSNRADSGSSNGDSRNPSAGENGRHVARKYGYSIQAPEGFRISRSGRRTVWRGPDDAQMLVEIGGAASTPRAGWESLERSLQKKYGAKYQSRGIREAQINGRNAAIWEFELETKKGCVRKIDVALHDGKNGFAVLGSAPADKFENYRAQFEKSVASLQIETKSRTATPRGY